MHFLKGRVSYVLTASALCALAGCSGAPNSSSSAPAPIGALQPQSASRSVSAAAGADPAVARGLGSEGEGQDSSPGFADADAASTGAIIVTTVKSNDVSVYSKKGKLVANIAGLNHPDNVVVGPNGDLYIANDYSGDFLIYKNDYKTLKAKLNGIQSYASDIGVAPKTGIVGTVWSNAFSGGPGSAAFYPKGSANPCATIAGNDTNDYWWSGAFDADGNFYVVGQTPGPGFTFVGVIKGGCSAKAMTLLTTANTIADPGTIRVSPTGKILITDQQNSSLDIYDPPVNGALGTPVIVNLKGSPYAYGFALTSDTQHVWVGNQDQYAPSVSEYSYPAGGKPIATLPLKYRTADRPLGIAVTPAAQP